MGLDTLDEFSPKDTDPVSLGDDAIRLTRAATKQSVGLEHYLDGVHKIPNGALSVRPAAGRKGRIFFNTDTNALEYDNGAQWVSTTTARALAGSIWNPNARQYGGGTDIEVVMPSVWQDNASGMTLPAYNQLVAPNYSCWVILSTHINVDSNGGYGSMVSIQGYTSPNWVVLGSRYSTSETIFNLTIFQSVAPGRQFRVVYTNATGVNRNMTYASFAIGVLGAL